MHRRYRRCNLRIARRILARPPIRRRHRSSLARGWIFGKKPNHIGEGHERTFRTYKQAIQGKASEIGCQRRLDIRCHAGFTEILWHERPREGPRHHRRPTLPQLIETVDKRLREFEESRRSVVLSFVDAYPALCKQAAERLRGIYNPLDDPPVETVVSKFKFNWQYVSFRAPDQLREISSRIFQTERDKAAQMMAETAREVQQVLRAGLTELVENLSERLKDEPGGKPRRLRESTVQSCSISWAHSISAM
jgi:hypothetical protein